MSSNPNIRLLIAEDERNDPQLVRPASQDGYGLDAVWAFVTDPDNLPARRGEGAAQPAGEADPLGVHGHQAVDQRAPGGILAAERDLERRQVDEARDLVLVEDPLDRLERLAWQRHQGKAHRDRDFARDAPDQLWMTETAEDVTVR